jgi:GT2 family glycosyltransferase
MKRKKRYTKRRETRKSADAINKRHQQYDKGYSTGYAEGMQSGYGNFDSKFEGTSIVIPTYNKLEHLQACIASIIEETDAPHEIIVVDNGSSDGTTDYLKRQSGRVRYRLLDSNHGFAGAVNYGMMMAKGTTLMVLNNDTIVAKNWLENMLQCLHANSDAGLIGPVTNYISGEQQIDVPYGTIDEMKEFARAFNRSDAGKWRTTSRLPGFCWLMRRELWERIGYLDEGFLIGNFEDDDYNIRVRLLGGKLLIAGDTFVHHVGSVSVKSLSSSSLQEINKHNEHYLKQKWPDPTGIISQAEQMWRALDAAASYRSLGECAFYPDYVAVRGIRDTIYWIERGVRRPIEGVFTLPVTRLPQLLISRYPLGQTISAAEAEDKWRCSNGVDASSETPCVVMTEDGLLYVLQAGERRLIAGEKAAEYWGLTQKPRTSISAERLVSLQAGLPIISPVILQQSL